MESSKPLSFINVFPKKRPIRKDREIIIIVTAKTSIRREEESEVVL